MDFPECSLVTKGIEKGSAFQAVCVEALQQGSPYSVSGIKPLSQNQVQQRALDLSYPTG